MKPPEVGGRTLKKAAEAAALEAQNEGKEGGRQSQLQSVQLLLCYVAYCECGGAVQTVELWLSARAMETPVSTQLRTEKFSAS